MAKYLKITIRSPFPGTDMSRTVEVDDSFDPEKSRKDRWAVGDLMQEAVAEYVDYFSCDIFESDDEPEDLG